MMTIPEVAVVHKTFGNGGAELTCLHTIAALDNTFDVTLVTDREISSQRILNHFGLKTDLSFSVETYDSPITSSLQELSGFGFHHLQTTELERWLANTNFDLYISTKNELRLPEPAIQYVHFPYVVHKHTLEEDGQLVRDWERDWSPKTLYKRAWAALFFDETILSGKHTTVLANSIRTKRLVEQVYGVNAEVVSPPVQDDFSPPPWDEQKSGIVAIPGRLSPSKRIERLFQIVDGLPPESDLHLHIVGTIPETDYADRLQNCAPDNVTFEGEVSRLDLRTLLETNRYGLQARDENFGIALAEMVYAGCIPFAIDCLPFQELLQTSDLLFRTVDEATEKLATVLTSTNRQQSLLNHLESLEKSYRPALFRDQIRAHTSELLDSVDY